MQERRQISNARAFLAGIVLCAGCQGEPGGRPVENAGDRGKATAPADVRGVIGYSALTLTNPFFKVIAENMEDELASHGYQMLLNSGEQDVKRQAEQIDDFIVKEVSAIVINPCDSQSARGRSSRPSRRPTPPASQYSQTTLNTMGPKEKLCVTSPRTIFRAVAWLAKP